MLARIPLDLFHEWAAYYSLEPFGEERADARAAVTPLTIAQLFTKRGSAGPKLTDFMLQYGAREPRQQTPKQMWQTLCAFTRATGGRFIKKDKPSPKQ